MSSTITEDHLISIDSGCGLSGHLCIKVTLVALTFALMGDSAHCGVRQKGDGPLPMGEQAI